MALRPVSGYEDLYSVDETGRVWSVRRERYLKTHADKEGYLQVRLSRNGIVQNLRVHRLVCEAFHGPAPEGKPWALHGVLGVSVNTPDNLEWGSAKDNAEHRVRRDRTDAKSLQEKCVYGHEFSESNTRYRKNGTRVCKKCHANRARKSYNRKRELND